MPPRPATRSPKTCGRSPVPKRLVERDVNWCCQPSGAIRLTEIQTPDPDAQARIYMGCAFGSRFVTMYALEEKTYVDIAWKIDRGLCRRTAH